MANYYYDKYYSNSSEEIVETGWSSEIQATRPFVYTSYPQLNSGSSYSINKNNPSTWLYTISGIYTNASQYIAAGTIGYATSGGDKRITKYRVLTTGRADSSLSVMSSYRDLVKTTTYSRGSLISKDIILDNTYPSNGRHTDGYWYVRGATIPDATVYENINGVWVKWQDIYENIGGVWTKINTLYENINGVWVMYTPEGPILTPSEVNSLILLTANSIVNVTIANSLAPAIKARFEYNKLQPSQQALVAEIGHLESVERRLRELGANI